MGGYRNKKPHTKEKKLTGKDYFCFLALVKNAAQKKGSLKFVVVDKSENKNSVLITETGNIWINGNAKEDIDAREFIAKNPGEFERCFTRAVKKNDPEAYMMPELYLAKLTDLSGAYRKPAKVKIFDGSETHDFRIERAGLGGRFFLDEIPITKEEAASYIKANYTSFLVGMKEAVKGLRNSDKFGHNRYPGTYRQLEREKTTHSKMVDGKIRVDINSFLPPIEKVEKKTVVPSDLKRHKGVVVASKKRDIEED